MTKAAGQKKKEMSILATDVRHFRRCEESFSLELE